MKNRGRIIREMFSESAYRYKQNHIGKTLQVLWEKAKKVDKENWQLEGLSDNYIRTKALSNVKIWNFMSIKL